MRKGDVVAILWQDSVAPLNAVWLTRDDIDDELPLVMTVGRVVKQNKTSVTVAGSWGPGDPDSQLGGVMTIPKRTIVGTPQKIRIERG